MAMAMPMAEKVQGDIITMARAHELPPPAIAADAAVLDILIPMRSDPMWFCTGFGNCDL